MSLSEERNEVNEAGGFVNIHAFAGSFIFSFLFFTFTESRKNQMTDPLGGVFFFFTLFAFFQVVYEAELTWPFDTDFVCTPKLTSFSSFF